MENIQTKFREIRVISRVFWQQTIVSMLDENDIKEEMTLDDQFTVKSLMVMVLLVTATDICRVGGRCAAAVGS